MVENWKKVLTKQHTIRKEWIISTTAMHTTYMQKKFIKKDMLLT